MEVSWSAKCLRTGNKRVSIPVLGELELRELTGGPPRSRRTVPKKKGAQWRQAAVRSNAVQWLEAATCVALYHEA